MKFENFRTILYKFFITLLKITSFLVFMRDWMGFIARWNNMELSTIPFRKVLFPLMGMLLDLNASFLGEIT
jgi:hypothetical protein